MKKILIILVALFSFLYVKADVIKMQSTELALKLYDYETQSWHDWSDWEDCSVLIVINTDNDTFTIYSSQIQKYDIYKYGDQGVSDGQDGKLWYFDCVNEDGLRCAVRLRIQSDGARQLYVDYSDASWVYNVYIK